MNIEDFSKELIEEANKVNILLNSKQIVKLYNYMKLLLEWNKKINLTAITDEKEIIVKHFIDSLLIAKYIKPKSTIIDVGTGAGFPGIPLKIYDDSYKITLLDSLNKRTVFLKEVAEKLGLSGLEIIHNRAEDCARDAEHREMYDYSISRAVAPLNILLEYLVPYTKVNGTVIAMKGSNANEELRNACSAIEKLNVALKKKMIEKLPNDSGDRYILIFNKHLKTNEMYPRKAGTPKKNPL